MEAAAIPAAAARATRGDGPSAHRSVSVGVAGVRTVAPGFEPGEIRFARNRERASARERKLSVARQGGLTSRPASAHPRANAWATFSRQLRRRIEPSVISKCLEFGGSAARTPAFRCYAFIQAGASVIASAESRELGGMREIHWRTLAMSASASAR
jgi:hypothetical protein